MKRTYRCRCGALIVSDDETLSIRHERPQCVEFQTAMEAAGMRALQGEWAEVVDAFTGDVKKRGQA